MNDLDRKILEYLCSKDKVAIGAMAHQLSITGESIAERLSGDFPLIKKDYLRIEWPVDNARYVYITEKGRKALWTKRKRAKTFLAENWINLIAAVSALVAALVAVFR